MLNSLGVSESYRRCKVALPSVYCPHDRLAIVHHGKEFAEGRRRSDKTAQQTSQGQTHTAKEGG